MKKISNEVLCERLENFFRENKEDHLTLITQTTKTNGRVTALETFKNKAVGAMVILNLFVVPVVMYLFYKQIQ